MILQCAINQFLVDLYTWLTENITWIKDFTWIVFTAIATIVAIKTYRNAKKTLFQPLNTEVIKEQKDLFIKIYHIFKHDFFTRIDYYNVFVFGFFSALREIGYKVCVSEKFESYYESLVSADLHLVSGTIEEKEISKFKPKNHQETTLIDAPLVKGEPVFVFFLQLTDEALIAMKELEELSNDPLLPSNIKIKLKNLMNAINNNFLEVMMPILTSAINQIWMSKNLSEDDILNLKKEYYNDFVIKSDNHEKAIADILAYINKYLKVDELFK